VTAGVLAWLVWRYRNRLFGRKEGQNAAGSIRIVSLPPGEAPFAIRLAWVGLELPLAGGQSRAETLSASGVLSEESVEATPAYAVEGSVAVQRLNLVSPEAAAWWRENAPHVLAPGYLLVFPADVCELLQPVEVGSVAPVEGNLTVQRGSVSSPEAATWWRPNALQTPYEAGSREGESQGPPPSLLDRVALWATAILVWIVVLVGARLLM
jgi:hypothetical protein